MKSSTSKTRFHKLYLIEPEMYDKILPKLDDIDRQEILDLNEENKPEYRPELDEVESVSEDNIDNIEQSNPETSAIVPESEEMDCDEDNYFDPSDSLFGSEAIEPDQLHHESHMGTSPKD